MVCHTELVEVFNKPSTMKTLKWLKKLFTGSLSIIDKQELFFLRQLESKNEILHKDIYNLICKTNEPDGIATKMRYEMNYDLQKIMFQGTRDSKKHFDGFCGIFNHMEHD